MGKMPKVISDIAGYAYSQKLFGFLSRPASVMATVASRLCESYGYERSRELLEEAGFGIGEKDLKSVALTYMVQSDKKDSFYPVSVVIPARMQKEGMQLATDPLVVVGKYLVGCDESREDYERFLEETYKSYVIPMVDDRLTSTSISVVLYALERSGLTIN